MKLQSNNHSVFIINYHLVLVIKYRRNVISDAVSDRLHEIFEHISPSYNISIEEWKYDKDHVHILFSSHPNTKLSKFVNVYKSASSMLVKKEFPEVKTKLWKEFFWSRSFCLISTGGANIETIRRYIEGQGKKVE